MNRLSATLAAIALSTACTTENIATVEKDKDLQAISETAINTQGQVMENLIKGPTTHNSNPEACLPSDENCDFIGAGWKDTFMADAEDSVSQIMIGTDNSMFINTCNKTPKVGIKGVVIRTESNPQIDPKTCKELNVDTYPSTSCESTSPSPDAIWSSLQVPCSPTSPATLCQGIGENWEDRSCEEKPRDEAIVLIDDLHKKFSDQIEKLK
ncbi:hypothetical protein M0P48_03880 [Candidatus Gracilibacteria bacterium]|nr:hypothetical protein [Candidatus Gracilibacteria bacterium]